MAVPRHSAPCDLQGCAAFPWDFPDSRAGAAVAADALAVHDTKQAKATKAKQPHVAPQWECLAAVALQQPSAEPQQPAPSTAAVLQGAAALHAAAAAAAPVDQQPADEQPSALVQPTSLAGKTSADSQAEPCGMDVDSAAPPAATAAAAVAEPGAAGSGSPGTIQAAQTASGGTGAAAANSPALAPSLLPTGWWVARSVGALLQAMPHIRMLDAAAAAPQQRPPRGGAAAAAGGAGAAPAPAAAADAPAASVPGAGLPSQQAAGSAHLALSPASHAQPAAGAVAGGVCLVRVRLHMAGRGVAQPGAAVCGPAAGAGCSADAGAQQLIGFVMASAVRGASAWAGATALCGAAALDRYTDTQWRRYVSCTNCRRSTILAMAAVLRAHALLADCGGSSNSRKAATAQAPKGHGCVGSKASMSPLCIRQQANLCQPEPLWRSRAVLAMPASEEHVVTRVNSAEGLT